MRATLRWAVIGVLAGAAAFELALALGAGSLGQVPGDGVDGEGWVRVAAFAAIIIGIVVAIRGDSSFPLIPVAAAAFVVASFYTYDPYFAPSLRRYSDGGALSAWWIYAVLVIALATAVIGVRSREAGRVLVPAVLILCLVTAVLAADGH